MFPKPVRDHLVCGCLSNVSVTLQSPYRATHISVLGCAGHWISATGSWIETSKFSEVSEILEKPSSGCLHKKGGESEGEGKLVSLVLRLRFHFPFF
jgi:hypothetical protein